jgi:hypothetical protein
MLETLKVLGTKVVGIQEVQVIEDQECKDVGDRSKGVDNCHRRGRRS